MKSRSVRAIHKSHEAPIGDLLTRGPMLPGQLPSLNPFLMLAHHGPQVFPPNNQGLPFDAHPHAGFETVTFILDGVLAHIDSGGHESTIAAGGVQWMTAGAGIVHNEIVPPEFRQNGGKLELMQLWVNLPSRLKRAPPAYTGLQRDEVLHLSAANTNATVHLISGAFENNVGPFTSLTGVAMMTVTLLTDSHISLPAPAERRVFFYVIRGELVINGTPIGPYTLVEFNSDADHVQVSARSPAMILFGHADPIDEPIVARGPFVMNTEGEMREIFRSYSAGQFSE